MRHLALPILPTPFGAARQIVHRLPSLGRRTANGTLLGCASEPLGIRLWRFRAFFGRLTLWESVLGACLGRLGLLGDLEGCFWGHPKPSCGCLGALLCNFGVFFAILGLSWGPFGPSRDHRIGFLGCQELAGIRHSRKPPTSRGPTEPHGGPRGAWRSQEVPTKSRRSSRRPPESPRGSTKPLEEAGSARKSRGWKGN